MVCLFSNSAADVTGFYIQSIICHFVFFIFPQPDLPNRRQRMVTTAVSLYRRNHGKFFSAKIRQSDFPDLRFQDDALNRGNDVCRFRRILKLISLHIPLNKNMKRKKLVLIKTFSGLSSKPASLNIFSQKRAWTIF